MAEHPAVNRRVVGSSPTLGANFLAGVAELADAQDLKSCVPYRTYRFDPGLRHQDRYRGVEQLVARRAHNPEVGGSSPPPATKIVDISRFSRYISIFESLVFLLCRQFVATWYL